MYDANWQDYVLLVRRQLGAVEFCDLVYLRSEYYVVDQRRQNADYEPPVAAALRREGRQDRQGQPRPGSAVSVRRPAAPARLSGGAALQAARRHGAKLAALVQKVKDLETRIKLVEGEVKGHVDLSQFLVKPQDFARTKNNQNQGRRAEPRKGRLTSRDKPAPYAARLASPTLDPDLP